MSFLNLTDPQSLHYYFDSLYAESDTSPLHLFVTTSRIPIDKSEYYAIKKERSISIQHLKDNFYRIEFRIKKRGAKGWLETRRNHWIFYIRSDEWSSGIGDIAENWITGMFPFISHARVVPQSLFDILDIVDAASNHQLEISDYLSRRYMGKKYWASQKDWERQQYDRKYLEQRLFSNKNIMDSVRMQFKNSDESFTTTISKNGHITYYEGGIHGFTNFYRLVVESYVENALGHIQSLENREAKVSRTAENEIFPIRFYPIEGSMLTYEQFDRMVRAARDQSDYSVSVIHQGNPWLYLSILDRSDGSSYDIYGFNEKIEIVPLLKASSESLSRIEDLVYDVFTMVRKEK